jgi:LuxR family transcriptional regulator, maltose regulon positive regulatory protein
MADGPRARLLAARLILSSRAGTSLAPLLAERAGWAVAERLEAALLLAAADPDPAWLDELRSALTTGQETGWVAPFLGFGPAAEACLARLPVAELHPDLAAALASGSARRPDAAPSRLVEALTPRERTLLELLPTHLSYAQLGDELFLSVNTIKSNLKSIYRKLGVTSRSEAVDAATALGLLDEGAGAGLRAPAARARRA